MDGDMIFCDNPELKKYLLDFFDEQIKEEMKRKFLIGDNVKFIGTLYELANCIDDDLKGLDAAKAVMYDGATGCVIGSHLFNGEVCYTVDFGDVGYHNYIIPEKFLED